MNVKITNYGEVNNKNFISYEVSGLSCSQLEFLFKNLDEETKIEENNLKIEIYFDKKLYPFQSKTAKTRIDDFIAREEIEMNIFLSSFLEDM